MAQLSYPPLNPKAHVIFLSFLQSVGRNPISFYGLPPADRGNDIRIYECLLSLHSKKTFTGTMKNVQAGVCMLCELLGT